MPDHTQSAFVQEAETRAYVIHRIGKAKEHEKLYGPIHDMKLARARFSELVEHFVRQHGAAELQVKGREFAKVQVQEHDEKRTYFFVLKPVIPCSMGTQGFL